MFITVEEIRSVTSFDEIGELTDGQIQGYIERADAWIRRATGRDFDDSADERTQQDIRTATWLLVELLWYMDNPEIKEEILGEDETIRLGSFTVNKKDEARGNMTGSPELDAILNYYAHRYKAGIFFQVFNRKD